MMRRKEYHIGLSRGEVSKKIILCGDSKRVDLVAEFFDKITFRTQNREFVTVRGFFKSLDITAISTGIGPDNMEIAIIELCQIVENPIFIRVGSCGVLRKDISLGDLIISTAALRFENTSTFFVPEGYPAVAHYKVITALIEACKKLKLKYHAGITACAPGFYGAQGREVAGFPLRFNNIVEYLSKINVVNFEMETSVLFTLSQIKNIRAGAICATFANRIKNKFAGEKTKEKSQKEAILAALNAFVELNH